MSHNTKPIPVIATHIKTGKETLYPSIQACADHGTFSRQYVMQCVHGTALRHCGHTFRVAPGNEHLLRVGGKRVRQVAELRNKGLTTAEICDELGLKQDTVQKYGKQAARLGLTTHIMAERH